MRITTRCWCSAATWCGAARWWRGSARPAMSPSRSSISRCARARKRSTPRACSATPPRRAPSDLALRLGLADQVLDELPGDAARAVAARHRPFDGAGMQRVAGERQAEMIGIALDHAEERVLVAGMEAEP